MSIAGAAGMAQLGVDAGKAAFVALVTAEASIMEAQRIVRQLRGEDEESGTLADWITLLNQTHSQIIQARASVPLANEMGKRFITNLFA